MGSEALRGGQLHLFWLVGTNPRRRLPSFAAAWIAPTITASTPLRTKRRISPQSYSDDPAALALADVEFTARLRARHPTSLPAAPAADISKSSSRLEPERPDRRSGALSPVAVDRRWPPISRVSSPSTPESRR